MNLKNKILTIQNMTSEDVALILLQKHGFNKLVSNQAKY